MSWSKDALFERSAELTLRLHQRGRVTIVHRGKELAGNHNTLGILEAFSVPITMDSALANLRGTVTGFGHFTEVMDQILWLQDEGVIADVSSANGGVAMGTHDFHYDSFPVHIRMLNDVKRTRMYQDAIRRTVRPDDVVLEIGTGTGVLTATAALAGARHVYTIERTAIALMARKIFEANGILDRITQIDSSSVRATLPEKATVLVSEMLGNDPLSEDIRGMTVDAVRRLLAPDARLLPERVRVYAQPVTVPPEEIAKRLVSPRLAAGWKAMYGVDFEPMAAASANRDFDFRCRPQAARGWSRICDPLLLLDLDLRTAESVNVEVTRTIEADPGGLMSGILVYFEALLGPAGWLSTASHAVEDTNHWTCFVWVPGAPRDLARGETCELTYTVRNDASGFRLGARDGGGMERAG